MSEAEHFKAWLRSRKLTYGDAAFQVGRSAAWIGEVARGHYPWYQAGRVPGNIWDWARRAGMPDLPPAPAALPVPDESAKTVQSVSMAAGRGSSGGASCAKNTAG
jgi:hypothetical protein